MSLEMAPIREALGDGKQEAGHRQILTRYLEGISKQEAQSRSSGRGKLTDSAQEKTGPWEGTSNNDTQIPFLSSLWWLLNCIQGCTCSIL